MPETNDIHCHFFSRNFLEILSKPLTDLEGPDRVESAARKLGWDTPGTPAQLAENWREELDHYGVARAALIASVPGDEDSVAAALKAEPGRFVGFFMVDPTRDDAPERVRKALRELGLRGVCLFPAMHRYRLEEPRVREILQIAAATDGTVVFVHCGVLSIGARKRLGLPSRFDLRCGNPLDLHMIASDFPQLHFLIPHFGAGFFREALMAAELCPNILFDTSSSNGWLRYHPNLTLHDVFGQSIEVLGPERIVFGSDSSFFPRGWNPVIRQVQEAALDRIGVDTESREKILGGNFDRLFPRQEESTP